jgi:hypothetical protein
MTDGICRLQMINAMTGFGARIHAVYRETGCWLESRFAVSADAFRPRAARVKGLRCFAPAEYSPRRHDGRYTVGECLLSQK